MKIDRIICSLLFDIFVLIKFKKLNKDLLTSGPSSAFMAGVKGRRVLLSWDREMFYREGLAFREAAIASILNNKYDPNEYIPYEDYEGLRYIGYGFWNGFSRAFGVNKLLRSEPQGKGERLMCDGEGFSITLLISEKKLQRAINRTKIKSVQDTCTAIGRGRALWWRFLEGAEFDITQSDAKHALLCGMVLASCFTQVGSRDHVDNAISSFIKEYPKSESDIKEYKQISLQMLSEQSAELKRHISDIYGQANSGARSYEDLSNDLFNAGK